MLSCTFDIPYRTKFGRTKATKLRLCVDNFVRPIILSVEIFVQYFSTIQAKFGLVSKVLYDENLSDKVVLYSLFV